MGIYFGPTTSSRSYTCCAELAAKLRRKGAASSVGAVHLLTFMSGALGGDPRSLCPEEAEQAARSLSEAAGRLRGADRRLTEQIAADARAAADSGQEWIVG